MDNWAEDVREYFISGNSQYKMFIDGEWKDITTVSSVDSGGSGNDSVTFTYNYVDSNDIIGISGDVRDIVDGTANIQSYITNELEERIKKLEEKDMLEAQRIVNLYKETKIREIEEKFDKEYEELYNKVELIKRIEELTKGFEASMEELYNSQFEEGKSEDNVDESELQITKASDENSYKYEANFAYVSEEMEKLMEEKDAKVNEIEKFCEMVSVAVGICKEMAQVEEVFVRYGIYDKSKKLDI